MSATHYELIVVMKLWILTGVARELSPVKEDLCNKDQRVPRSGAKVRWVGALGDSPGYQLSVWIDWFGRFLMTCMCEFNMESCPN